MVTMTAAPTYEDFLHKPSPLGAAAREFVNSLTTGVPAELPEMFQGGTSGRGMNGTKSAVTRAAKNAGMTVKYVQFDGRWWACRLRPEDVKPVKKDA